jgi:hypothetical protein
MQLPAALEGKQGKCPSCSSVVTISTNALANPARALQQPLPLQMIDPELLQSTIDQQRKQSPQQQQPKHMIEAEQTAVEAKAKAESPDSGGGGCLYGLAILLLLILLNVLFWVAGIPLVIY